MQPMLLDSLMLPNCYQNHETFAEDQCSTIQESDSLCDFLLENRQIGPKNRPRKHEKGKKKKRVKIKLLFGKIMITGKNVPQI